MSEEQWIIVMGAKDARTIHTKHATCAASTPAETTDLATYARQTWEISEEEMAAI